MFIKLLFLTFQLILLFQRIAATVNTQEQKRLLMDLDISMRSSDCPYTVQFYGALFREGDVWICMEVMDMSLDKFYTRAFGHQREIPENILGKITVAVRFLLFPTELSQCTCSYIPSINPISFRL